MGTSKLIDSQQEVQVDWEPPEAYGWHLNWG